MNFTALVLAGTRPGGDPLAGAEGKPHKALIEIEGRSLLERVVAALDQAGAETIGVSCDEGLVADKARELGCTVIETGKGPSESAAIGFVQLGAPMVLTTADHALLQPDWVADLVGQTPEDADLGVMLARREDIEQAMPGSRRTYLKFADGQWSGCNLFFLRTPKAQAALDVWRSVEADRKRPWRIAARLGFGTLLSMLLGRLALAEGLSRLGKRVGLGVALVPARNGLAAVDVDKPGDLIDVRRLIENRRDKTQK